MKQPLFAFFVVFLLASVVTSLITNETYTVERNFGIWSDTIQAQPEIGDFPSQYFLCGISFRESQWQATLWNCNCHYGGIFGRRWTCKYCVNYFWSQVNAVKATFCNSNDWNMQIEKIFETGGTKGRNWREQVKCPKGQYVSKASGRLGFEHGVDLGYVGTQFRCENINFSQGSTIQDGYNYHLVDLSRNRQGNMVSGFNVKYVKGGIITGIKWNFQSIPRVSKIAITYEEVQKLNPTSVIIQTAEVPNNGSTLSLRSVALTKSHVISNRWNNALSFTSGYFITQGVLASPLPLTEQNIEYSTYSSKTDNFAFNKQIKTTYSSTQQILVLVTPGKTVQVSGVIQEQKVNVPYVATLYFEDRFTGQVIGQRIVKGVWQGVMASSVKTVITEAPIAPSDLNSISSDVPKI